MITLPKKWKLKPKSDIAKQDWGGLMISFQYKVFFEVATTLSFTKAAELLFISQPAVSNHIKKLEADLGVPLFERKGNSISLTQPGVKLLEHVHQARHVAQMAQADVDIVKNQREMVGELKIGASTTISLHILPKVLSAFHKKHPRIQLMLINRNTEHVLEALLKKEIDIAVVESKYEMNGVQYSIFMEDEIIPVCSPRSAFAQSVISLEELKKIPLAMRERGSGTLSVLMKEFEGNNIKLGDLQITARLGGTDPLKKYLIESDEIGFLSKVAVQEELEKDLLKRVDIQGLTFPRHFYFVTRKGEELPSFVQAFKKQAKETYNV